MRCKLFLWTWSDFITCSHSFCFYWLHCAHILILFLYNNLLWLDFLRRRKHVMRNINRLIFLLWNWRNKVSWRSKSSWIKALSWKRSFFKINRILILKWVQLWSNVNKAIGFTKEFTYICDIWVCFNFHLRKVQEVFLTSSNFILFKFPWFDLHLKSSQIMQNFCSLFLK